MKKHCLKKNLQQLIFQPNYFTLRKICEEYKLYNTGYLRHAKQKQ